MSMTNEEFEEIFGNVAFKDIAKIQKYIQEKIENKDREIDLMAEIFYKRFKAEFLLENGFENEEQLKQYFEDLVEV